MIFVTVGTHEQQFNRLVRAMDELRENGSLDEDIIIQTGYSTYEPRFCKWNRLFSYQDMFRLVAESRIVVTHGGPSSFIMPLQIGKVPIVVPRQKQFEEHVNDHQMEFCRAVAARMENIIVIEDIKTLSYNICNYEVLVRKMRGRVQSSNAMFNRKFEEVIKEIFGGESKRK